MKLAEPQNAFVLHTKPYRETSLLVEVFSEKEGRVSLCAKGVRAKKNPKAALLQCFYPLQMTWRGRSELQNLMQVEMVGTPFLLQGKRYYSGFYLNELLLYLLPRHHAYPELFHCYAQTIESLAHENSDEHAALRQFEFTLLDEIGYGLQLTTTADDQPIEPEYYYHFQIEHGFTLSHNQQASTNQFLGRHLLAIENALSNNDFSDKTLLKTAKSLTRLAITPHLHGKELKSRQLYQQLYFNSHNKA